ncbi:hypothetical protein FKW77_010421 [Venturia effusa]|uniref:Uncharacterized protein n=1 Tax=Venturia effusa TaxID=50376 RepID=A0A517L6G7_9PEZI|nr:hypothetical protein FKW77_010421 [Venturia effusa]
MYECYNSAIPINTTRKTTPERSLSTTGPRRTTATTGERKKTKDVGNAALACQSLARREDDKSEEVERGAIRQRGKWESFLVAPWESIEVVKEGLSLKSKSGLGSGPGPSGDEVWTSSAGDSDDGSVATAIHCGPVDSTEYEETEMSMHVSSRRRAATNQTDGGRARRANFLTGGVDTRRVVSEFAMMAPTYTRRSRGFEGLDGANSRTGSIPSLKNSPNEADEIVPKTASEREATISRRPSNASMESYRGLWGLLQGTNESVLSMARTALLPILVPIFVQAHLPFTFTLRTNTRILKQGDGSIVYYFTPSNINDTPNEIEFEYEVHKSLGIQQASLGSFNGNHNRATSFLCIAGTRLLNYRIQSQTIDNRHETNLQKIQVARV